MTAHAKDRAATEARILDAARTVFALRGYDAAGLREIADLKEEEIIRLIISRSAIDAEFR